MLSMVLILVLFVFLCYFIYSFFDFLYPFKKNEKIIKIFCNIKKRFQLMYDIYNLCKRNKNLNYLLNGELTYIRDLFETKNIGIKKMINLFIKTSQKISSYTPSFLMNRVSEAIILFDKNKNDLKNAIVNCFLFRTNLNALRKFEQCDQKWSIPKLNDKQERKIFFEETFNPMIDPKKVITNDILFDEKKGIRNILLAGVNGGGKTQLQQALGLNILYINAYGICPGRYSEIIPLDYFYFLQDISTNITDKKSKFKNEVYMINRVFYYNDKITDYYKKNKIKGEKPVLFFTLDEILEGTDFETSTKILSDFVLDVTKNENVFLFLIHHNKNITEIPKKYPNQNMKNFYMDFVIDNNILKYKYKIKGGVAPCSTADHLVKKMIREGEIYNHDFRKS